MSKFYLAKEISHSFCDSVFGAIIEDNDGNISIVIGTKINLIEDRRRADGLVMVELELKTVKVPK